MERMNKVLIYIAGFFMLVLVLIANLQVLSRFVLHIPFGSVPSSGVKLISTL